MQKISKISLIVCGIAVVLLLVGIVLQQPALYKPSSLISAITLALGLGAVPSLKGYQYTAWIVAAVVAGMMFPSAFTQWGDVNLRDKTLILIVVQLVMFGMGTSMSLRDFNGLATTGKGVLVGLLGQFTIMPLMGLLLITVFQFEPEIAAGVILIGSCSSGLASNVMVYLAKANLTLSVIMTAMATLIAPFMTPLLMKILAGTLIEVSFVNMMIEIIKIVIVPISAALLHDYLKTASSSQKRRVMMISISCTLYIIGLILFGIPALRQSFALPAFQQSLELSAFLAGSVVVGFLYHLLYLRFPKVDKMMPLISMAGIVYFTTVTTAAGRENLMQVGFLLFIASVIHNAAGYFFGYWFSRLLGLNKTNSRTIAFEVGLQNGGMASGLAGSMGKLGTVGLAAAVFSPWMNISGSILANYWRKRPVNDVNTNEVLQSPHEAEEYLSEK